MSKRRNAPMRYCAECGKPVRHSWRDYVLCDKCLDERTEYRQWFREQREARRVERLESLSPTEAPKWENSE